MGPAGVPGWLRAGRGRGPALRRWQWASPSPSVRGARAGYGAWGRGWASARSQGPAQARLEAVPAPSNRPAFPAPSPPTPPEPGAEPGGEAGSPRAARGGKEENREGRVCPPAAEVRCERPENQERRQKERGAFGPSGRDRRKLLKVSLSSTTKKKKKGKAYR